MQDFYTKTTSSALQWFTNGLRKLHVVPPRLSGQSFIPAWPDARWRIRARPRSDRREQPPALMRCHTVKALMFLSDVSLRLITWTQQMLRRRLRIYVALARAAQRKPEKHYWACTVQNSETAGGFHDAGRRFSDLFLDISSDGWQRVMPFVRKGRAQKFNDQLDWTEQFKAGVFNFF